MWTSPAIDLWNVGQENDIGLATTLPLDVFTQRNFVLDVFRVKLNFAGTNSDIAFCVTFWGDLWLTYTVHLWLVGKSVVDFV